MMGTTPFVARTDKHAVSCVATPPTHLSPAEAKSLLMAAPCSSTILEVNPWTPKDNHTASHSTAPKAVPLRAHPADSELTVVPSAEMTIQPKPAGRFEFLIVKTPLQHNRW